MTIATGKLDVCKVDASTVIADEESNGRKFRHNQDEIVRLAESIKEQGQLQPCVAVKKDGVPHLVFGYKRLLAVLYLNERGENIPLIVKYTRGNAEKQFMMNVVENNERSETTCIDDAHNIDRFLEVYGWDRNRVSSFYRRTPSWVSQRLKLLTLPEDIQEKAHEGGISGDVAYKLAKVAEKDENRAREMLKELSNGQKITGDVVDEAVQQDEELEITIKRKIKNVRTFFNDLTESEDVKEASFAKSLIKWLDGETTDPGFKAAWNRFKE